jgi:rhamnulokinase
VKAQCYLGIDLGAESGRVMAGLWDGKRIKLRELHRFPNVPVEIAGSLRWDVLRLWADIQNGLAIAAKAFGSEVRSAGVDTWGVDSVLLSKSNELLCQPFHYRDNRTRGMMNCAFKTVSRAEIFDETGLQFMELNTLYQLLALKKSSPEILAAADCLLMMPDFFHWCLSGVRVGEFTNASTTQLVSARSRNWSRKLLKKFALPAKIFPNIVRPGTRIGPVRSTVAERVGLKRVEIVAPASHDTGSAVAAVPVSHRREGTWAYLSSGTWSLMGVEVSKARLSEAVLNFNLTNEGGVDDTYRLLKNISGLWLIQQCKRSFDKSGKSIDYAGLVSLAQSAPALKALIDPDDARFTNPDDMPSAIQQFCRRTRQSVPTTKGAIVRCALESLALKYRVVLECLEHVTRTPIEVIHIVGGGSQNVLLNQMTADACNRTVIAGPVEATVLGNVLVQARACSEIGSLAELRTVLRSSTSVRNFDPRPHELHLWADARGRFSEILKASG